MAISLQKGGNISLDKVAPGINKCSVELGWGSRVSDGDEGGLHAMAINNSINITQ
jgi:tellurium resistance protein TerD